MPLYQLTADEHYVFPFLFDETGATLLLERNAITGQGDVVETDEPLDYEHLTEVSVPPPGAVVRKATVAQASGTSFPWLHRPRLEGMNDEGEEYHPAPTEQPTIVQRRLS